MKHFFFFAMQDLTSPDRDGTHAPCREAWSLNPWTTKEILMQLLTNTILSKHDIGHQIVKEITANSPYNSKFPIQDIIQ